VHDGNAYALGGVSGHAGLFSTAHDLGKFAAMILNDGCYRGNRILNEASIKLIGSCYTDKLNETRGLGWRIKRAGDAIGDAVSIGSLYHTGFTGTSMLIDRTACLGFVLLTNRIHPSRNNESLLGLRGHINDMAEQIVK
jgi:CubicO group peptidase (beta-lactamase class C family)